MKMSHFCLQNVVGHYTFKKGSTQYRNHPEVCDSKENIELDKKEHMDCCLGFYAM